jgi:hypothetical protein
MAQCIPTELVALARSAVEKTSAEVGAGGSMTYAQLIVSELYEALRLELTETPPDHPAKRGLLAAAIDQCRRSASAGTGASLRVAELAAVLDVLESAPHVGSGPPHAFASGQTSRITRFRVIEGGLSKSL